MEKQSVAPGTRRPWALDELPLLMDGKEVVIDLKEETHDKIIRDRYHWHRSGLPQTTAENYTFEGGLFDGIRLFDFHNRPPYSFTGDFHAEQLCELRGALGKTGSVIKKCAIIGTGHSADQILNALYILDDGDTKIHVFEMDQTKIDGAGYLLRKLGFGSLLEPGGKIQFHKGNVIEMLPRVAKQIGGFDLIDLQLVLQHLRGDDFGNFLKMISPSLGQGGLLKGNELMLGQFGRVIIDQDTPELREMKREMELYTLGDGTMQNPGFLNLGWRLPKGHAWNNRDEFVNDILTCAGENLKLRPDLEMSFRRQNIGAKDPLFMKMRYLPPILAAPLTARARAKREDNAMDAALYEAMAAWAWEKGEAFDRMLTSKPFLEGRVQIEFSELIGVVFQKI